MPREEKMHIYTYFYPIVLAYLCKTKSHLHTK